MRSKISVLPAAYVFAALALICASAHAQLDTPIIGIPFGKKLDRTIPQCPRDRQALQGRTDYCSAFGDLAPGRKGLFTLMRPEVSETFAIPSWVHPQKDLSVIVGPQEIIDFMRFYTEGPQLQLKVLESVSGRFGPPTKTTQKEFLMQGGARFKAVSATWDKPGVRIEYECLRNDLCSLEFQTPASVRLREAIDEMNRKADQL